MFNYETDNKITFDWVALYYILFGALIIKLDKCTSSWEPEAPDGGMRYGKTRIQ